jgi:ribosomal protein S18 acetylase RimI-like enzyme
MTKISMSKLSYAQIRKATGKDADGILSCLRAAFDRYRSKYTPEGFADTVLDTETIQARLQDMNVLVAVSGEVVIGTIGYGINGQEGHLRGMAVHPDWQGTGVALLLLGAAENELHKNGCTFVTLDTTEPLKRATRFYEKYGFSASGKISDFFGMPLYEYSKSLADCHDGEDAVTRSEKR